MAAETLEGDHWELLRAPAVGRLSQKIGAFLTPSASVRFLSSPFRPPLASRGAQLSCRWWVQEATVAAAASMADSELRALIESLQSELQRR